MLKGHVFSKQIFANPIFALFINTFLNGENGISDNYKNSMNITQNGFNLTVDSGAVCVQGRFLEEDSTTTITADAENAYCKLVIEIDLDKQNTESSFNQASYKIIKNTSGYPNLTQNNIVKNVEGVYQYELARFRTTASGITDFQDTRTFLDFDSIYEYIENEIESIEDGSQFVLKTNKHQAFYSEDGASGLIDLDSNTNEYKYIEIIYGVTGEILKSTGKVLIKTLSTTALEGAIFTNNTYQYRYAYYSVGALSIFKTSERYMNIQTDGTTSQGEQDTIRVFEVNLYKE